MKSNLTFKHNLIMAYTALAFANITQMAFAEEVPANDAAEDEYTFMDSVKTGKNLTSFRLRYENVSQDGLQPGTFANGSANPTATNAVSYTHLDVYKRQLRDHRQDW